MKQPCEVFDPNVYCHHNLTDNKTHKASNTAMYFWHKVYKKPSTQIAEVFLTIDHVIRTKFFSSSIV